LADLSTILPVTLKYEGGWANNPHDPGGATMKGITLNTFRSFRTGATATELHDISDADVLHIYDVGYFRPIGGATKTQGVGMVAFDYGVNSGPGRANKVLNATGNLAGAARVRAISDSRLSFLHGLSTWAYFGKGWGARVGACEAVALRWEAATPSQAQVEIDASVDQAKKKAAIHKTAVVIAASSTAPVAIPSIVKAPTTSTVTEAPTVAPAPQSSSPLVPVIVIGALIAAGLIFGLLALHNSQRAAGLKA